MTDLSSMTVSELQSLRSRIDMELQHRVLGDPCGGVTIVPGRPARVDAIGGPGCKATVETR